MSYTIEKLPNEPIVVSTGHPDFNGVEGPKLVEDMFNALDAQTGKVYLISDMSAITLNVDDLLQGASLMTRGQKPVFVHPNIIENVFVTTSSFIRMAAKGLSAPVFGGLQVKLVDTIGEALTYCRGKMAGS